MDPEEVTFQCDGTPIAETQFGPETGNTPSEAIVTALADVKDVAPTELDPLYETVDGESIDRLFTSRKEEDASPRALGFIVEKWNVVLHGSGSVIVYDAEQDATPVFGASE